MIQERQTPRKNIYLCRMAPSSGEASPFFVALENIQCQKYHCKIEKTQKTGLMKYGCFQK